MKVRIKTKDVNISLPLPITMVGTVAKLVPERVYQKLQEQTPAPYDCLVSKENISMILSECVDILKENKGLEVVHVEGQDGTFVSIKL